MLFSLTPLVLHLLMKKPRSQSMSYDLAGLITDPPSFEPEKPVKSFAKIRPIEEVELPIDAIQQCLIASRDLSRPHAVQRSQPIALDAAEKAATEMPADKLIETFSTTVNLEKDIDSKEATVAKQQTVQTHQESKNVVRQSNAKAVQQRPADRGNNRRSSHVRNLDTVLDIQASRRPRGY